MLAIGDGATDPRPTRGCQLVTLFGQSTSTSRRRSDDHAIARVDDRLTLVIPPNTIVLVTRTAQQLDHLPATRRSTVQSARLNLIPHLHRAGHSHTSHVLTSDIVEPFCCSSLPAPSTTVRSADSPRGYLLSLVARKHVCASTTRAALLHPPSGGGVRRRQRSFLLLVLLDSVARAAAGSSIPMRERQSGAGARWLIAAWRSRSVRTTP